MKEMLKRFKGIRFSPKSAPVALLVAMVLAFGLMIPWLGFYYDDWHHIYYAYARGISSLWELLNYDARPFAAWVYVVGFSLLGFSPLAWQVISLLLRWLTVTVVWAIFQQIWPERTRQNFIAALLFAIYPLFVIQPSAVAYSLHWVGYLFCALSIWLMLLATKKPRWFILFTILALASEIIHLFTLEYYAGIELLRPILLWFLLADDNWRKKAVQILRRWLPYLIILIAYFIWRGFIYQSPIVAEQGIGRGVPSGLNDLLASPLQTMLSMFLNLIPDMVFLLISAWYQIITPDSTDFNLAGNLLALGPSLIGGILMYFYLRRNSDHSAEPGSAWKRQALIIGVAACLFGILPAYAAGYSVHIKYFPWNARFALGSLFGAGLLITIAIESLLPSLRAKQVALAILVGLTIGWHTRYTNIFRHAWETETDFYQQLTLRVPSIAPHTAFLAEDEFLSIMGDYPESFALNTIYTQPLGAPGHETKTWLFFIDTNLHNDLDGLLSKTPLLKKKLSVEFVGKSDDSIVFSYRPDLGQCLWVITPNDENTQIIPATLRTISSLSNERLIGATPSPSPFLRTILPSQPENWCAYYQRGSLAFQFQKWDDVVSLWETASKKGLRPSNGFEYLPFIEAYGMSDNWPKAIELTKTSNKVSKGMDDTLCAVWTRLQAQTTASPDRENAMAKINDYLGCSSTKASTNHP